VTQTEVSKPNIIFDAEFKRVTFSPFREGFKVTRV
jgi:hypothetical protein